MTYGFKKRFLAKPAVLALAIVLGACAAAQEEEPVAPAPPPSPPAAAQPPADADRTVLDGVFTVAQANRGEATFQQICAACHNAQEFRGSGFQRVWDGRTLGDLHQMISTTMPLDAPGSLTSTQYTEIISFFLRQNGYPEGQAELPPVRDALRDITIVPAD